MDAKGKQASGGVEFAVISALVFLGLDSKPRIPVGENLCILAWIDRDGADIQYFRRRRLGKRRHCEKNKRDHKIDFSCSRNHPHKFHFSSSSLPVSGPVCIVPIQNATNSSRFLCLRKSHSATSLILRLISEERAALNRGAMPPTDQS